MSMDRFFASLPAGRIVKRANWSVTSGGGLFRLGGTHMSKEEFAGGRREEGMESGMEMDMERERENFNANEAIVRCERQTLHRLEKTGALLFAFKVSFCFVQTLPPSPPPPFFFLAFSPTLGKTAQVAWACLC